MEDNNVSQDMEGQISNDTLRFLKNLQNPRRNDRQWFKLHEPVYRTAEKEWITFIESLTDLLIQVDPQIPPLPPKDLIHRIYRDIRFSNDKTPYKQAFSATFSRTGRKGIFAGYHMYVPLHLAHPHILYLISAIKPGNQSIIAAGSWCPARPQLANIRANILHNPSPLRQSISSPEFQHLFGQPSPHPQGKRQSIFGMHDQLKSAPKGVDKNHKDIDLLKCRSFAVVHQLGPSTFLNPSSLSLLPSFTDAQVLDPQFKNNMASIVQIMLPFVHWSVLPISFHSLHSAVSPSLNDMMITAPNE
ncbi:hypothetical protein Ac2012v2_007469 [Leucoagaricus gongylophorus]